jgi:nitrogen-specific signal transduction histidine kinase
MPDRTWCEIHSSTRILIAGTQHFSAVGNLHPISIGRCCNSKVRMKGLAQNSEGTKPQDQRTRHLRSLAHDLSNSLETILQAAYLLEQAKLDDKSKKWVKLIDGAANDAVRLNRQFREILKNSA